MEEGEGEGALNMNSSRKEKRKAIKKMKRKQMRKEMAERERQEEEAVLNDPEEQHRLHVLELQESQRMERERIEFLEREKQLLVEKENKEKLLLQQSQSEENNDEEELLPEIIWQGNEIIFKKKLLRVPNHQHKTQNHYEQPLQDDADTTRPSSNPLPPESHILENVAQQVPNFGTEQDKSHCPFHLKTGVCRFGQRCSRVHFYPDNSCTLLIKNMYNGPGLAWEQDEGLEYTDEEVERCYEEFYEDVHTEFLKFGEIVNFKVCKNGSFHLRGNVYVQYKLLDSALLAYNSVNGRYFAGKQISCTFVNLTRWKVAICGEYMKSGFKTCSHGTACNFIHCFRNPGGDYEWADSDKPPPKYWVKKMAALFGYCDDYESSRKRENLSVKNSSKMSKTDSDRDHSRRSRSREMDQLNSGRSGRRKHEDERKQISSDEEHNAHLQDNYKRKRRTPDIDSDGEWLEKEENREKHHEHARKSSFKRNYSDNSRSHEEDFDMGSATITRDTEKQHGREERNSRKWNRDDKVSKRKSSRHQNRDNSDVTSEAESDKDLFDSYSRKSLRHRRSGLQNEYKYHDNENEQVDGGSSRRESSRRAHHHKKKSSKHQKKMDSTDGDTNNACWESSGE